MWPLLLLAACCLGTAGTHAQVATTFPGSGGGAIPDNNIDGLTITIPVSGVSGPISGLSLDFTALAHTWTGDLNARLTSPGGVSHDIFLRVGRTTGDCFASGSPFGLSADLGGDYSFNDGGAATLWGQPNPIAPGTYRTTTCHSDVPTSLLATYGLPGEVDLNGTWTVVVSDHGAGDVGSVGNASLVLYTSCTAEPAACTLNDLPAYEVVVANDDFCCLDTWDEFCQADFDAISDACGGPGCPVVPPDCVLEDAAAYTTVVGNDDFCCNDEWDEFCQADFDAISDACAVFPDNQFCEDVTPVAIAVPGSQEFSGDNTGAIDSSVGSTYGAAQVWEAFTTDACAMVTISYCGNANVFDPVFIGLSSGCPAAYPDNYVPTTVYEFTSCGDGNPTVTFQNLPAGTYYVPIYSGGAQGPYSITISTVACPPPPANDECADAIEIGDGVHAFSTIDATGTDITSCTLNDSADIWFLYVATCDGTATATTCNDAAYDTALSVFDACGGNEIGCNDDGPGCTGFTSTLNFGVTAGTSYWIRVAGFNGATGTGNLTVSCSGEPPSCTAVAPDCVLSDNAAYLTVIGNDAWCCNNEWDEFCQEDFDAISDACLGGPCPAGEIQDCNGNCAPANWVGDGFCDDGSFSYNGNPIFFNCPEFNNDEGDCDAGGCTAVAPDCVLSDEAAYQEVIANDAFCCNNTWDGLCQSAFDAISDVCIPDAPANDDCANATVIAVQPPAGCPDGGTAGTTAGSTQDGGDFSCIGPLGFPLPDVWYAFNSGTAELIQMTLTLGTQANAAVEVFEAPCTGASVFCQDGAGPYAPFAVTPNTDYIIRVGTTLPGTHTICVAESDGSVLCTAVAPDCVLSDDAAYQEVIANDPFCCNNTWDEICQADFDAISDACAGGPACTAVAPDCVLSDEAAYQEVIANDAFCCNNTWDDICQEDFDAISDACLPPSCAAEAPACVTSDIVAYQTVVDNDPSCCEVEWSEACQTAFDAISDNCTGLPANQFCEDVAPVAIAVPGNASFSGNSEGAIDSSIGQSFGFPQVWESFSIADCATVTLSFCGSTPGPYYFDGEGGNGSFNGIATACPASFPDTYLYWSNWAVTYDNTICADGGLTMVLTNLPAGDYWVPIWADYDYELTVSTEECVPIVCTAVAPDCVLADEAAYQQVIMSDAFCCNNTWDEICQNAFDDISTACTGGCITPPACVLTDDAAYQEVIANDPFCCETAWDEGCQEAFDAISTACTDPACTAVAPDCVLSDDAAYQEVIANDPFCCDNTWDTICQDAFDAISDACLPPACAAEAPGCVTTDVVAYQTVVADDPSCCEVAWTTACQDAFDAISDACSGVPANDDCANAIVIGDGVHPFSTVGATGTDITSCAFNDSAGIWYEYVATCDGLATATTCDDADYDTVLSVWDACGGNEIGCNDDGTGCTGFTSTLSFPVSAGTSYWVRVAGYNGATGTGNLTISCNGDVEFPENDECGDAITLTVGPSGSCPANAVEGDMSMATTSPGTAPSCLIAGLTDVWYAFNSGDNTSILWNIDMITLGAVGIQVLDACDGNEVFCQGDQAVGIFPVTPNTDYVLRVLTLPDFGGTYTICLEGGPEPPTNDECESATVLAVNLTCEWTPASSLLATESVPADACSGWTSSTANDVWFTFTANASTQTVAVENATFDVTLGVYSDCGTLIDCVDDVFPDGNESMEVSGLVAGATYFVRVYGWAGATGVFDICVYGGTIGIADHDAEGNGISLWPNPNNGQQLWLEVSGMAAGVQTIAVDIHDLSGKRIVAREMALPTGQAGAQHGAISMDLNGDLAAGTYVVTIIAGDQRHVERLVIAD
jgi:subtilisin-like proprotein convertase family protein